MKKILSASICAIAMAAAVPAFAATDAKPMHHHGHHMKSSSKMGPHTKMKAKGDPTTEDLNAKSLDAARGGATPDAAAPAPAAPATPPSSSTGATMAPSNAPGGGQ